MSDTDDPGFGGGDCVVALEATFGEIAMITPVGLTGCPGKGLSGHGSSVGANGDVKAPTSVH